MNIECSGCGATLKAAESAIGKRVRCPKCSEVFHAKAPTIETEVVDQNADGIDDDLVSAVSGGPRSWTAHSPMYVPYYATPVQLDQTTRSVMFMLKILLWLIFGVIGVYLFVFLMGLVAGIVARGR